MPQQKKINRAHGLFLKNLALFRCPLCEAPWQETKLPSLQCAQGHSFDLAKNGYCNLLTRKVKKAYGRDLFQARRAVFQAGLFAPLVAELTSLVANFPRERPAVLDAGCGEGSLLAQLSQKLGQGPVLVGLDVAKEAIQLAGAYNCPIMWCVGDLARLPLADNSFDLLLNVLSPANYSEFRRVLKPTGIVFKAIPGKEHLREIRGLLAGISPYENKDVVHHFQKNLEVQWEKRLFYQFSPGPELWPQLLKMTPLSASRQVWEAVGPQITIDLLLLTGNAR